VVLYICVLYVACGGGILVLMSCGIRICDVDVDILIIDII